MATTASMLLLIGCLTFFVVVVSATRSRDLALLEKLQEAEEEESSPVKRGGVRLCGMRLVNLVTKLCNHCIVAPENSDRVQLLDKKSEKPHHHHMLKRSGLAEQCCHNRCAFSDLKMYCCK